MAPSCRGFCTYSQGQLIGTPHSEISFEQRMALALEIDESLGTQASKELLGLLVTNLGKRIEAGEAHKAGLLNLLPALDKRTKISKSIFASAQQFLTGRLEDFEDFSNASNFVKKFPGAIADEELDRIRQEFCEFSRDYADIWDRDPDVLRSTAEDITAVGQGFKLTSATGQTHSSRKLTKWNANANRSLNRRIQIEAGLTSQRELGKSTLCLKVFCVRSLSGRDDSSTIVQRVLSRRRCYRDASRRLPLQSKETPAVIRL